jgi:alpha-N-acetylglucosamine transferase
MNPYRDRVRHRGDLLFAVAGVLVALALVLWALLG